MSFNWSPGGCCCVISQELWGPFRERVAADTKLGYYYASPMTWETTYDFDTDNSFTIESWKVDDSIATDLHTYVTLTSQNNTSIYYEVRINLFGIATTTPYYAGKVNASTQTEVWIQQLDGNVPSLGSTNTDDITDFVYQSNWGTWRTRIYNSTAINYVNSALPNLGHGTTSTVIFLTCQYTDQWACDENNLYLLQYVWKASTTDEWSVLTTISSTGVSMDEVNYNPTTIGATIEDVNVASGTTSPSTPARDARLQVLCPRTYPDAFGVRPAVQWDFTDASATYTVEEDVEVVFGTLTAATHGYVTETASVFSRTRTRTAYQNNDNRRLNANVMFGDSNEDGDWACVFYWGEETLDGSGNYDSHTAKVVVATSGGEYDSVDLALNDTPEEFWCDMHMIRDNGSGTRIAITFEFVGTFPAGYWKMHAIDLTDATTEWTVNSTASSSESGLETFYTNNKPWVIGSNDQRIYVANFPQGSTPLADKTTSNKFNHAGSLIERIIGYDGSTFVEWAWDDPGETFGAKVDTVHHAALF